MQTNVLVFRKHVSAHSLSKHITLDKIENRITPVIRMATSLNFASSFWNDRLFQLRVVRLTHVSVVSTIMLVFRKHVSTHFI
jgi:hypothetical protein